MTSISSDTLSLNTRPLVDTDWLQDHLDDADLRVFDCTVIATVNQAPDARLPFSFASGRARFDEGHVPGAGFLDLIADLSDPDSELPFTRPSAARFAEAAGNAGIGDGTRVVLYATSEPIWAARVWWLLRSFGFDRAAVLDGGWAKWANEGRAVSRRASAYPPARFTPARQERLFADRDQVLAGLADPAVCTLNALPPMVFAGTGGPVFGRKGRIAGSVNVPFASLHDPHDGTYLPADELRRRFAAAGVPDAKRVVTYCGSGIAASDAALALALIGQDDVAVYDGSMSEWGYDETLPMEAD